MLQPLRPPVRDYTRLPRAVPAPQASLQGPRRAAIFMGTAAEEMVAFAPVAGTASLPLRRRFGGRGFVGIVAVCVCLMLGALLHTRAVMPQRLDIMTQIQQSSALRLTLHAKRKSMVLNGLGSATIYVVPHGRSGGSFDAVLTQAGVNVTETYLLVNDRAYYIVSHANAVVSVNCLDPSQLPPLHSMQVSLNEATIVDAVEMASPTISPGDCLGGKWLQLRFAGETFVFCKSPTHMLTHAISEDLDMTIEYISDPSQIPSLAVPPPPNESLLECPLLSGYSRLPTLPAALQSPAALNDLPVEPRIARLGAASCQCKLAQKKPCLFVHGLGKPFASDPTNSDGLEWGSIQNHAPCCSSTTFVHFETWKHGWNNDEIQNQFCDTARRASLSSSTTIQDLILVTYSMGNLVAGGAVATGKCSFGSGISWISIAGPMQGSKTANLLERKCKEGGWNIPLKGLLELITLCPMTDALKSLKDMSTVDATLQASYRAAQVIRAKYATKLLCGSSPFGLVSVYAPVLSLVSKLTHHDDVNDGVVAFSSCAAGFSKSSFSTNFADDGNYLASVNHLDNSFRLGDGWWGADRKPTKWFECAL
ncbi:hypothetical protein, variant [Saprolegnia diclina VS20]|uniref:Uncharacterized protein n=1 Tax=Saprolegnia diclina (strain VS20) TaxID=1156394 RepID=T0RHH1_SAPDV|nr:hypothetical protein, variant [Saprolegnia diclina VS20]EQC29257.1 hypothetical protein, variant [Saprolegnia diclina VS20]|eukprot:XP_008617231.1 hypothetical protein, variant [Saprolegnia diclina VS20]